MSDQDGTSFGPRAFVAMKRGAFAEGVVGGPTNALPGIGASLAASAPQEPTVLRAANAKTSSKPSTGFFVTGGVHFSSVSFAFTALVLILNVGVFARLMLRRQASERWVALAVAFAVVEACVTLLTPERFTLLYFAGRVAAFCSACASRRSGR